MIAFVILGIVLFLSALARLLLHNEHKRLTRRLVQLEARAASLSRQSDLRRRQLAALRINDGHDQQ